MMAGYPPPVSADELRPRRFWYWVAGAVAVLGVLAGIAAGAFAAVSAAGVSKTVAELDPRLRAVPIGVPTPVDLDPGRDWAVYASSAGPTPQVSCGGDGLTVTDAQRDLTTTRDAVTWQETQLVRVAEAGRYSIICTSPDRTTRFALGRALDPAAADRIGGRILGTVLGFVGAFALASLGVLAGGVIVLVVALRRRTSGRAATAPG